MRSVLSILGLVIVLAIVLLTAKKQLQSVAPPVSPEPSASASSSALPRPEAVGREVQDLMKQGERRASEAE